MIVSGELTDREIAQMTQCSERTIRRHRANLMCFGSTSAPRHRSGRPSSITSPMLAALREHLLEKPDEDLDGMVLFIWDEFGKLLSRWSVRRALSSIAWSPKAMRRIARGRSADLRDYDAHVVSEFPSWCHLYVDESGCDKRIGFRRWGWSPRGVTPGKDRTVPAWTTIPDSACL